MKRRRLKRRCERLVSVEAFEIVSQEGDVESCGDVSREDLLDNPEDLSDCELDSCAHVRVVPDVTDVLVSPSSVVTELCDGTAVLFCLVLFCLQKRARCGADTQEEMRYEGSPVNSHPF